MQVQGHCYCGAIRYEAKTDSARRAQCHCRECQYLTGGGPNYFMMIKADDFHITQGTPKTFTRSDIENPVTRHFCPDCGTQLVTTIKSAPMAIVKVGTLDDPAAAYEGPQMAIFTIEKQPFHVIPEGLPAFERAPTRA